MAIGRGSSVVEQVLAGQPAGAAGVDEAGERLDQHRPAEVGQVVGELVQLVRVEHPTPPFRARRSPRAGPGSVETGLVGAAVFLLFLRYLFVRLRASRELGRRFAAEGLALARRVRPLAWGMTAALAGTMAANFFYLTMQFYYFYAFAVLVLALPIVFARRESG